jgi:hypothetical protein
MEELENGLIEIDPTYQRDVVWTSEQQGAFINSVLLGIIPNPIIFNIDKKKNKICIDGKQRITSIKNFINNKISVKFDSETIYYSKSYYDEETRKMTEKEKEYFKDKTLNVVEYKNLSYSDQVDVFNRIQYGTMMTEGELSKTYFRNEELGKLFYQFCNTENVIMKLKKFNKNNIRCNNFSIVGKIICMVNNNDKILITEKKKLEIRMKKITNEKEFKNLLEKTNTIIKICFDDKLLNHDDIPNNKTFVIYALISWLLDNDELIENMTKKKNKKKFFKILRDSICKVYNNKKISFVENQDNFEIIINSLDDYYNKEIREYDSE